MKNSMQAALAYGFEAMSSAGESVTSRVRGKLGTALRTVGVASIMTVVVLGAGSAHAGGFGEDEGWMNNQQPSQSQPSDPNAVVSPGKIIGGILGGLAGAQVGHGKGSIVAAVIGTMAGSMAGNAIERSHAGAPHANGGNVNPGYQSGGTLNSSPALNSAAPHFFAQLSGAEAPSHPISMEYRQAMNAGMSSLAAARDELVNAKSEYNRLNDPVFLMSHTPSERDKVMAARAYSGASAAYSQRVVRFLHGAEAIAASGQDVRSFAAAADLVNEATDAPSMGNQGSSYRQPSAYHNYNSAPAVRWAWRDHSGNNISNGNGQSQIRIGNGGSIRF